MAARSTVVNAYCDGATWQNGSNRNSKEAFAAINLRAVLEKVSTLPINTRGKRMIDMTEGKESGRTTTPSRSPNT
jgi:hypothetical protein